MLFGWSTISDTCSATFLSPKERREVERRLQEDHGHLSNDFDMKYVWQAIGDWKIYIFMFICMAGFCPIYSFALFLPTIIKYVLLLHTLYRANFEWEHGLLS